MFSDSIFEIIETLAKEYHRYNADPYEYSHKYYDETIEILTDLYQLLHKLDSWDNKVVSIGICRGEAVERLK